MTLPETSLTAETFVDAASIWNEVSKYALTMTLHRPSRHLQEGPYRHVDTIADHLTHGAAEVLRRSSATM